MQSYQISHLGSLALDLSRIKNIRINPTSGKQYELVFELNGRAVYSQHPETKAWEKEIINEEVRIAYDDFEMADAYFRDWVESWKEFTLQT
jgi:hypothetical protein